MTIKLNRWHYESWRDDKLDDLSKVYLGNLQQTDNGELLEIPVTMYSDYSGSTVERANCDYFVQYCKDNQIRYFDIYGDYGTTGVMVYFTDYESNEDMREMINALDNYPLFDDESLSNLELQLEDESWDSWVKYDLIRALDKAGIEYNEDTLQDDFYNVIRENNIEFIFENAVSAYIKIDEVIKHWQD